MFTICTKGHDKGLEQCRGKESVDYLSNREGKVKLNMSCVSDGGVSVAGKASKV